MVSNDASGCLGNGVPVGGVGGVRSGCPLGWGNSEGRTPSPNDPMAYFSLFQLRASTIMVRVILSGDRGWHTWIYALRVLSRRAKFLIQPHSSFSFLVAPASGGHFEWSPTSNLSNNCIFPIGAAFSKLCTLLIYSFAHNLFVSSAVISAWYVTGSPDSLRCIFLFLIICKIPDISENPLLLGGD